MVSCAACEKALSRKSDSVHCVNCCKLFHLSCIDTTKLSSEKLYACGCAAIDTPLFSSEQLPAAVSVAAVALPSELNGVDTLTDEQQCGRKRKGGTLQRTAKQQRSRRIDSSRLNTEDSSTHTSKLSSVLDSSSSNSTIITIGSPSTNFTPRRSPPAPHRSPILSHSSNSSLSSLSTKSPTMSGVTNDAEPAWVKGFEERQVRQLCGLQQDFVDQNFTPFANEIRASVGQAHSIATAALRESSNLKRIMGLKDKAELLVLGIPNEFAPSLSNALPLLLDAIGCSSVYSRVIETRQWLPQQSTRRPGANAQDAHTTLGLVFRVDSTVVRDFVLESASKLRGKTAASIFNCGGGNPVSIRQLLPKQLHDLLAKATERSKTLGYARPFISSMMVHMRASMRSEPIPVCSIDDLAALKPVPANNGHRPQHTAPGVPSSGNHGHHRPSSAPTVGNGTRPTSSTSTLPHAAYLEQGLAGQPSFPSNVPRGPPDNMHRSNYIPPLMNTNQRTSPTFQYNDPNKA